MKEFVEQINALGNSLTNCPYGPEKPCQHIGYDRSKGIVPRCLFFYERGYVSSDEIIVVIGKKPGLSGPFEFDRLKNVSDYEQVKQIFGDEYLGHHLYNGALNIIKSLELKGPILWTELAKCEGKNIATETMTFCASKYLVKELELAKKHFSKRTFIVLGKEAYDHLIFTLAGEKVIGIPHPTGSWGSQFKGMFSNNELLGEYRNLMYSHLNQIDGLNHKYFKA